MKSAEYWIQHLGLLVHPEGGFYKETYRSAEKIPLRGLPERFSGDRNFSTSIYFLLRSIDKSLFHRIKSDELWHYHAGSSLSIYVLNDQHLSVCKLGPNIEHGESLQVMIPANSWFGAAVDDADTYALSGCTVAPGFDFQDFEIGERKILLNLFPHYQKVIELLTKGVDEL